MVVTVMHQRGLSGGLVAQLQGVLFVTVFSCEPFGAEK